MVNDSALLHHLTTDNLCTKNEKSSFSKPKICSLYMRAVTDQERMSVYCGWLKFGSTAALNCCTGQNKGRYRKKKSSYCYSSRCFRSWENILIQCAALMDWRRPRPQLNLEGWRTVPIGNRTGHANLRAIIRLFFPPACNNPDDIILVQKFVWYETNVNEVQNV